MGLAAGSMVTGTLGFLQVNVTDDPANPTNFSGVIDINLVDPGANDNKVTLGELAALNDLANLVHVSVAGSASARLDLALSSQYDLSDLSASLPAVSLPKILADLDASWNLNDPTNPTVGFGNIRLDIGSFFKGFSSGASSAINENLEPIKPVLDFLSRRIPVLSDISALVSALDQDGDGNVTMLDAVAMLGGTSDTRMIAGLAYVVDLIDSVTSQ